MYCIRTSLQRLAIAAFTSSSSVMLSGTLHGRVPADRLTLNGNGVLADPNL